MHQQLELEEAAARHAVQVLRMRQGDTLCITNGAGTLHTGCIASIRKKNCTVAISATETIGRQTPRRVGVAISPLKNNGRFEWFLEKATELGIADIFPIICHRTERQHFRAARLQAICISAMLQSQQTWLPVLHEPLSLSELLEHLQQSTYHHKWVAHCANLEKHHLAKILTPGMHDSLILIGPEGDFTPEEILKTEAHGYVPVSLGETRLRTETAGVVASTLLCLL